MPRFYPNIQFSDCWGSAGNVTFYHVDGKCFWRSKAQPRFPGTDSQLQQLDVHRRALAAWKALDNGIKEEWRRLAVGVTAHRPPFLNENHISGYNLFVSAYHGFALMGDEIVPRPQPFTPFPDFRIELDAAAAAGPMLQIHFRLWLSGTDEPQRYRLLTKVQVVVPGRGCHPGKMRNCLTEPTEVPGVMSAAVSIPAELIGSSSLQLHVRYLLIDSVTGYRSNFRKWSFVVKL